MQTIVLLAFCAVFYALFEIFAGLAGGKINDWLAAVLYNGTGTVIPLIVYISTTTKGKTTVRGAIYAGLAGVGIMLFSVLLARLFNRGGNLSYVIPTIYGAAIVISSIYGYIFLKEKIGNLQLMGLCFVVAGVFFIVLSKIRISF